MIAHAPLRLERLKADNVLAGSGGLCFDGGAMMRTTYIQGIPVVWRLLVPLYGEADAGRIWNRTLVNQLVNVQRFRQSQYDPCYFWKLLSDGTRLDLVMYVDDGYAIDAHSPAADAELRTLNDAFKLTIKPAHFFLGNNITVHDGSLPGPG